MGVDGLRYLLPFHNFMEGKGYTLYGEPHLIMPPGYGLFAYLAYLLVHDIELSGILVSAIAYILLIPVSYFTTRYLFGRWTAFLATLIIACSPYVLLLSYNNLSDSLFLLFYIASFSCFSRVLIDKGLLSHYIILGFLIGVAYLIRPEAFLLGLISFTLLIILEFTGKSRWRSVKSYYPLIGFLVFLITATPYILFIHKHTGLWTFSTKTTSMFLGADINVSGVESYNKLRVEHPEYFEPGYKLDYFEYIRTNWPQMIQRFKENGFIEIKLLFQLTIHGIIPASFLALFTLPLMCMHHLPKLSLSTRHFIVALPFLVFLSPLIVLVLFLLTSRYLIPYSLLLLILLAYICVVFLKYILEAFHIKNVTVGFALICALSVLCVTGVVQAIPEISLIDVLTRRHGIVAAREAGLWLRDNVPIDNRIKIMSPYKTEVILFYAWDKREPGGSGIQIGEDWTLDKVSDIVKSNKARYLILDNYYVYWRPKILPLWNLPTNAGEYGLRLLVEEPGVFQIYVKEK